MKEVIGYSLLILFIMALLIVGPLIWWRNYKECRTQFSVMYCATRK
jgi:hypothetical protein